MNKYVYKHRDIPLYTFAKVNPHFHDSGSPCNGRACLFLIVRGVLLASSERRLRIKRLSVNISAAENIRDISTETSYSADYQDYVIARIPDSGNPAIVNIVFHVESGRIDALPGARKFSRTRENYGEDRPSPARRSIE